VSRQILAVAGFFAGLILCAAPAEAAPRVVCSPDRPSPGELFFVSVEGLAAGIHPEVRFAGRVFLLWPQGKTIWEGLAAVDRDQTPGDVELAVIEANRAAALSRLSVRVAPRDYPEQRLTVPERTITLSPEDRERARREAQLIARALATRSPVRKWKAPVLLPAGGPVSGPFGVRRIYNGKAKGYHSGLDIAAARGTPVRCAAAGVVRLVGDFFYTGNTVVVDHGMGLLTAYFHMESATVAEGQMVRAGDVLGHVGSTGRSTGPHLHWGVYLSGVRADPMSWLRLAGGVGDGGENPTRLHCQAWSATYGARAPVAGAGRGIALTAPLAPSIILLRRQRCRRCVLDPIGIKMSEPEPQPRFEDLLARLESIVKDLESEELDLERSIEAFEEGVKLARECHRRLDGAERKVELLRRLPTGEIVGEPFETAGEG
jgi:exodeoxyribonuclease VII small subunit